MRTPFSGLARVFGLTALFFCLSPMVFAQKDESASQNKSVRAVLAETPITVDGELNEAVWQKAQPVNEFVELQPQEGRKAPMDVDVRILYSNDHLYVGVLVKTDPTKLRITEGKRDAVWGDDWVAIALDTFQNNAYFIMLGANPLGIQVDSRGNGNNDDEGYNVVYTSRGKKTDTGYQIEMEIPFSSLSYPNKPESKWGLGVLVNHPRDSRYMYTWPAISSNNSCLMCQFGTLENIKGIKSSAKHYQILPALVGASESVREDSSDPNSAFLRSSKVDPSLSLKLDLNSNTSAELALNPDFSQIESDADQISVNTTLALFYSERRPFFQEGADLFDQSSGFNFGENFQTVYSRSINKPIVAGKFLGRFGKTSVGYIGAADQHSPIMIPTHEDTHVAQNGRSISNILRMKQDLGNGSYVGLLMTDRRYIKGGSGSLVSVDGRYNLTKNYQLVWALNGSHTQEIDDAALSSDYGLDGSFAEGKHTVALDGETFKGYANRLGFIRSAKHWNFFVGYDSYSPTFRAENGFVSINNVRQFNVWQGYTFFPKSSVLTRINPAVWAGRIWDHYGNERETFAGMNFNSQWKGQTYFGGNVLLYNREVFRNVMFDDLHRINIWGGTNFVQSFGMELWGNVGKGIRRTDTPEYGKSLNGGVAFTFRPINRLNISPQINFAQMRSYANDELFYRGYILRAVASYQFTRALSVRGIYSYNDFSKSMSFQSLITYQINPLTVFYVGANLNTTEADQDLYPDYGQFKTDQTVFFKFQYLFKR